MIRVNTPHPTHVDTPAPSAPYDEALWAEVQPQTARRLLRAALESFAECGYHATTTRQIAVRAEMSPTAMYVHYASKADLLVTISRIGHVAVLDSVEAALEGATDPGERVRRFVAAFASWHARNHTLARVIQYELQAIPADRFDEIRALRQRADRRLREELQAGIDASLFAVDDLDVTTLAILSMGIDVARWYRDRPRPEAIGAAYADLAMRMLGAPASA